MSEPLCICPPPWNNDYTPNPKCPACCNADQTAPAAGADS